ncbi:MAG: adenine deaminase [Bacteroidales bacterium]|nr:adenine deaminase [Bacteroidales bacterium]
MQRTTPCFKGHIVDLVSRCIYGGELIIRDGRIAAIERCDVEDSAPYYLPGFIDSHVHIESSMMTPVEFARIALRHGTIGAVCDPHEIANVMGTEGIDLMLDLARLSDFRFAFGMPSCVPSCNKDIETSGYVLDAQCVDAYMKRDDIYFLAEMMNFPGVINGDAEVMAKIASARKAGKPVDGHAPGLVGSERAEYAAAGITTDHECTSMATGRSAVQNGMYVLIREGSAAKDYDALSPLIAEAPGWVMFCTDDCHPTDFVRGHIDRIVRRAIADGYDIMDVLTAACLTPVRHYHIPMGLLQVGDKADFIVLSDLTPDFRVIKSYIDGEKVYSSKGQFTASRMLERSVQIQSNLVQHMINNFHARPISEADLQTTPRDVEDIIVATDGSLFTQHEMAAVDAGVQKLVVMDRYSDHARPRVAYIKGFGLTRGAVAQSIAHDCHNIVAVGADDKELVRVINRVIEMNGGVAVSDGHVLEDLPLPIAGLISPLCGHELAFRCQLLDEAVKRAGCTFHSPFITLAFMCLPVIPQLKLTDKGLFDSVNFRFVNHER